MLIRWYWNAEAFATEGYRRKNKHFPRKDREFHGRKNKHFPRMNTEFHGKDRSRKLATERRHIFQSRMRERRYKNTVWEGPLRQAQGPGFLRYGQ